MRENAEKMFEHKIKYGKGSLGKLHKEEFPHFHNLPNISRVIKSRRMGETRRSHGGIKNPEYLNETEVFVD
jgi:hypothetical protein